MQTMDEPSRALQGGRPQPAGFGEGLPVHEGDLPTGVRVRMQNRLDGTWASGYRVIAAQPAGGYLVRRLADQSVLPIIFAEEEMRLDPVPLPPVRSNPWSPPAVA